MTSLRIALLVAAVVVAHAAPAPEPAPAPLPAPSDDDRPEIIEIIAPAASAQETLDSLNLGEPGSELSERNKRTIGILRQLFPTLTQIVEQKIQNFTSTIFQTFGPLIFRSLGGGGTGSSGSGTVTFDDDEDDDQVETIGGATKVSVALPAFAPDSEPVPGGPSPSLSSPNEPLRESEGPPKAETSSTTAALPSESEELALKSSPEVPNADSSSGASDVDSSSEAPNGGSLSKSPSDDVSLEVNKSNSSPDEQKTEASDSDNETGDTTKTIRKRSVARGLSADENQLLSGAESQQSEVRVQFAEGAGKDQETAASEDQETAAQSSQLEEISLEDTDTTEENRNKRQGFLNFGFGGNAAAGGSSGGGGGSGNFLFDIIRLVAGSSASEPTDDSGDAAAADGTGAAKGDNLTEGVPGPITRLFIIANRGIANLIQDLILRLAQTSERIVNFKARLITSII